MRVAGTLIRLSERTGVPLQRMIEVVATAMRLPFYLFRLGLREGLRLWFLFLFRRGDVRARVRGLAEPVLVRGRCPDRVVFERIFVMEEYRAAARLDGCQSILDLGAYAGYAALYFARLFPGARIIAVEPDGENFAAVRANVAQCKDIVPVRAALWSHRCALRIRNPEGPKWSFVTEETEPGSPGAVPGLSIADLIRDHGGVNPDFVKIDIEGAEAAAFRAGAEPWLAGVRLLIIELHDYLYPGSSEPFLRAASQLPFELEASGENVILWRTAAILHAADPRAAVDDGADPEEERARGAAS